MFLKISQFIKNTQQENTEYNDKKKLHIEVKQELNIKTPLLSTKLRANLDNEP